MSAEHLTARIDESSRMTGNGLIYVVGASVVLRGDETRAVDKLRGLRLPGQAFLHWQTESAERRRVLLEVVADLGFMAFVVTAHPVAPRRQERARARELKRLAYVLSVEEGIDRVLIESRGRLPDRRDAVTFGDARRQGTVAPSFRFEHVGKRDDPLMWAADIITSAQAYDLTTAERPYWHTLQAVVLGISRVDP
jgi:hypothetical protein